MNCLGGGERHNSADFRSHRSACARSADPDTAAPDDALLLGSSGDVRSFIHKSFIGKFVGGAVSSVIGSVPLVGGVASGLFDTFRGAGASTVPQRTGCPTGFIQTPTGCVPRFTATSSQPIPFRPQGATPTGFFTGARNGQFVPPTTTQATFRESLGRAADPAAGVAVMGRFGAGFEPSVFMTDTRRCGRGAVLAVDGLCYNKRDIRNNERFWPRGRRPLLTGGEMRAISTASSAAKKLQRKQKQLESLGLLKKAAPRSRRALPAGHRAELTHSSSHG